MKKTVKVEKRLGIGNSHGGVIYFGYYFPSLKKIVQYSSTCSSNYSGSNKCLRVWNIDNPETPEQSIPCEFSARGMIKKFRKKYLMYVTHQNNLLFRDILNPTKIFRKIDFGSVSTYSRFCYVFELTNRFIMTLFSNFPYIIYDFDKNIVSYESSEPLFTKTISDERLVGSKKYEGRLYYVRSEDGEYSKKQNIVLFNYYEEVEEKVFKNSRIVMYLNIFEDHEHYEILIVFGRDEIIYFFNTVSSICFRRIDCTYGASPRSMKIIENKYILYGTQDGYVTVFLLTKDDEEEMKQKYSKKKKKRGKWIGKGKEKGVPLIYSSIHEGNIPCIVNFEIVDIQPHEIRILTTSRKYSVLSKIEGLSVFEKFHGVDEKERVEFLMFDENFENSFFIHLRNCNIEHSSLRTMLCL